MNRTLVVYSGGLDSAVCLALARQQGHVGALTFDYNQSNHEEIGCATATCELWGVPQMIQKRPELAWDATKTVPGRNTIFFAMALKLALEWKYDRISMGLAPGSPDVDSSKRFLAAIDAVAMVHGINVIAPVLDHVDKTETLSRALTLGVPMRFVYSCRTSPRCGICSTCLKMGLAAKELFPKWKENGTALIEQFAKGDLSHFLEYPESSLHCSWHTKQLNIL